jgi:AAA15 family ATPase/GTPase
MKDLKDINVYIGSNDVGKSNILRALNLFFNNEVGYDEDLSFLQDVNHIRQEEARDAKGRLTIWMKIYFNNVEGWKTLPEKFFIKKSWNRYSDEPEVTSDVINKQSLTKFQNKVKFHYVPAIKEQDIFSHYLFLMYETLSEREDIQFSEPAQALSRAVNSSIADLTQKIKIALRVSSNIQIPNDLESIFERLEFYTEQDSFRVPLSRRGDGLQARHIPYILQYISANNRGLNIWAYEEPENSLEMSNAFALAREFSHDFASSNQIFITSHSPAFYSIEGKNARQFLVRKSLLASSGREAEISTVEDLASEKVADTELGVAQLVLQRSKEAFNQIQTLIEANSELAKLHNPVLLTEGKTDARILNAAWQKLYPSRAVPFEIRSCDLGGYESAQESAGADALQKILESTTKDQSPIRIGVFDSDDKGKACFKSLRRHDSFKTELECKVNKNKRSAAIILEDLGWGSPFDAYIEGSMCIEMMFDFNKFSQNDIDFEFFMDRKKLTKASGQLWVMHFQNAPDMFEDAQFRVVPKFKNKIQLAEKLIAFPENEFHRFANVFAAINALIAKLN